MAGKFGKFFLAGIFLGYSKQSEDLLPHSSANKIQPIANLGSQIRRGIFLGVDIWYRDFFGFRFLPLFNHSHHLKSEASPWGVMSQTRQTGHYVREMREEKSKAPCHMLCVKCPIGLTWPIKCLSCRLALSFSFFNIYFSIDVDKYKDILP